jgi:carboxymethylenebutenolidase
MDTDTVETGIVVSEEQAQSAQGPVGLYVAAPSGAAALPCIVVLHEIWGVHGHVDLVCQALARLGHVAVAPRLFTRRGDVEAMTTYPEVHALAMASPDHEVMADLDAAFGFLAGDPRIDAGRIGLTGFCWGGRHVWLYAAHNPRLRAAVAWYGGPLVETPDALRPRNPIDVADGLRVPVLGLYGGADHIIPLSTVERMQAALRGGASRIEVFADTPHGFHASNRPTNYRAEQAERAWEMMLAWFREHGVSS